MHSKCIYTSSKVVPYVYMGIHKETGQFYIGSRTTQEMKLPPEQDLQKYRTSSDIVRPIFDQFNWHIIAEFWDCDVAYTFEQQLIHENWNNPLILNKNCRYNGELIKSFSGKKHTKEHIQKNKENHSKLWLAISPDGTEYRFSDMKEFCGIHNLQPTAMYYVSNGKRKHHKFWNCIKLDDLTDDVKIKQHQKFTRHWEFVSPDGETILTDNLLQFSKQYNLDRSSLNYVCNGTYPNYKGWTGKKVITYC